MSLNLFPVFLVGLAGSIHCAGMCGGIVGALSAPRRAAPAPAPPAPAGTARAGAYRPRDTCGLPRIQKRQGMSFNSPA